MKRTFSDHYPKIQRLQGVILFPHDIQKHETKTDEGEAQAQYSCLLLRVPDRGQPIDDPTSFAVANYAALRKALYPSLREQFDQMYHGTWIKEIEAVKAAFPKPTAL